MQAPIEIMTQMMKTADSAMGRKFRVESSRQPGTKFEEMFGNALVESQAQLSLQSRPPEIMEAESEKISESVHEPEPCIGETQAAAVITNQNEIMLMLERDKESAATPKERVYADPHSGIEDGEVLLLAKQAEIKQMKPQPDPQQQGAETKMFEEVVHEEIKTILKADVRETVGTEQVNRAGIGRAEIANIHNNYGGISGDTMAWMPQIRTSEQRGNHEDNFRNSQNDNLSPLENENDTALAEGRSERTFAEKTEAAMDNTPVAAEQLCYTIPLSDGIAPEQFRSEQQMRQAFHDMPVKPEHLFDEMISRLESMKTESQRTMTIHLKPEFLGKVALELAMDAAGIHVKISAADSGVKTMISGQITALIESLQGKGLEVVEVEVIYTGVDNGSFKENRERSWQPSGKRQAHPESDATDAVTYYIAQQLSSIDYYLESGVSSVQYSV